MTHAGDRKCSNSINSECKNRLVEPDDAPSPRRLLVGFGLLFGASILAGIADPILYWMFLSERGAYVAGYAGNGAL